MKAKDASRPNDFIDISGSKMRALAAAGAVPCDVSQGKDIPSDLIAANCVPPGFMVPTGWDIVCDYYQNVDSDQWVPYSVQHDRPFVASNTIHEGVYGTKTFKLSPTVNGKPISPWHDIPLESKSSSG